MSGGGQLLKSLLTRLRASERLLRLVNSRPLRRTVLFASMKTRCLRLIAQRMATERGYKFSWHGRYYAVSNEECEIRMSPRHLRYIGTIVDQFRTYAEAVEPVRIGSLQIVDFSLPAWFTLRRSRRYVFLTNFSEGDDLLDMYLRYAHLSPEGVALDLGANCGLVSTAPSELVPNGLVIALEPDPTNYRALLKNLERSGANNVRPVNAAIWTGDGTIRFEADGTMGAAIMKSGSEVVRTLTLMTLANEFGLKRIDFVKMDVEGAELVVLPCALDFIQRYRPHWVIEVHDKERGIERLGPIFATNGYTVEVASFSPAPPYPLQTELM